MNDKVVAVLNTGNSLRRIVEDLRSFDEAELSSTLFPLSVKSQGLGDPVAYSAYALYELNPTCLLSVREAVEMLLPAWDISIEEVVFYLAKQFGVQAIENTLDELRSNELNRESTLRLETIAYWLDIYRSESNPTSRLKSGGAY